jgi:hypothetical protein
MKKRLFTLIIVCLSMISWAQNTPVEHLTFKGVPIDGTLNEFVLKMKQNGFTLVKTENGTAFLTGDFAGYKDCYVGVSTLKQKNLVSKIGVIFQECTEWSTLSNKYFALKDLLTQKYGEPTECIEKFETSLEPKNDNDKFYAVLFNHSKFITTYETEKGTIQLSIETDGISTGYVLLNYFDKINSEIIKAKALDDL